MHRESAAGAGEARPDLRAELKIRLWVWLAKLKFDWSSVQFDTVVVKVLGGHCKKLHRKWPVASCYFVL